MRWEEVSLLEGRNRKVALLFRSADDIVRTSEEFEMRGIRTIPFEAIEIVCSSDSDLESEVGKADYIIFISRNAVMCSAPHINAGMVKARIIATGMSTAKLLEEMGFGVAFAPSIGGIGAVLEWLKNEPHGRVAVLCESRSDFDFTRLEEKGFSFSKQAAYEAKPRKMSMDLAKVLAATHAALFSPLEVESMKSSADNDTLAALRKLKAVCLGKKTYDAASLIFDNVALARRNSIASVADGIAGDLD